MSVAAPAKKKEKIHNLNDATKADGSIDLDVLEAGSIHALGQLRGGHAKIKKAFEVELTPGVFMRSIVVDEN